MLIRLAASRLDYSTDDLNRAFRIGHSNSGSPLAIIINPD